MRLLLLGLLIGLFPHELCAQQEAIREVLEQQVAAWNQGDIEGFMEGYLKSDTTRFASGKEVYYGWRQVLARYKRRYRTRAEMGVLSFEDVQITPLSERYALVFGRWRLKRQTDEPSGLFTLLFIRTPEGWRIVHDHTSGG